MKRSTRSPLTHVTLLGAYPEPVRDRRHSPRRWLKSGVVAALLALLSLGPVGAGSVAFAQGAPEPAAAEVAADEVALEEAGAEDAAPAAKPVVAQQLSGSEAQVAIAMAVSAEVVTQARRVGLKQAWQHGKIPGGPLMVAAYFVLWIFIFAMIFMTMRRQRALNRELDELGRRMDVVFDDME
ncbi:CcmD family protein [Bradymonas sediminis]|uniref:Uncharacterized protein n=1 Tax=Bradymonas sediminis TaxID=1548548 RepID=A0A2Z4FLR9_9DELT|nr:CcmD family protein [Bradymonas sediminis]AWV89901.1 hypothetical protein DN745_11345 [Bradymonas sediminis]TDP62002.1 CcmD family protein [Bradymonas sediminis]